MRRRQGRAGLCFILMAAAFLFCLPLTSSAADKKDFGVFTAAGREKLSRMYSYSTVVIDPDEFHKSDIRKLHRKGVRVYGYLNTGSIETGRSYYDSYRELRLGAYQGWEDEYWIDVADTAWQDFLIRDRGEYYSSIGLDGFFVDNADVYYHYHTEDIYQGLVSILSGLKAYDMSIIVNGGDTFVSQAIKKGQVVFDGICQESVFTRTVFIRKSDNKTRYRYCRQKKNVREYYKSYLARARKAGLKVFLIEYRAGEDMRKQIGSYCARNGFIWYDAHDIRLGL